MASVKTACQQPCQLLRNALDASAFRRQDPSEYPPISSIPHTPETRLRAPPTTPSSVLYLAYGSNLCAETFLGVRGIRPLSRVSVSAPTLDLTFDLAGLPYLEPCFANTAPRKVPGLPDPRDPPSKPPKVPPFPPPRTSNADEGGAYNGETSARRPGELKWTKGLVGVVYEVTPEDYATIVATEGGGASYANILVPCFPLPPRMSVPEKPPIELPKPFFAHTLYAPPLPKDFPPDSEHPGDGDRGSQSRACEDTASLRDTTSDEPSEPHKKKWYWRFLARPVRPNPSYAQPSARYLKLITDGAREHELPDDYQRYLLSLHNYTITNWRQRVASWFLMAFLLLFFAVYMLFGKRLADDKGRLPVWLAATIATMFNLLWMGYDKIMKPIFGDGERTQEKDGESGRGAWRVWKHGRGERYLLDEEKRGLLEDME